MIFGINTTCDISKLSQISSTYNNFEISLMVFMPNITANHAITYTNKNLYCKAGSLLTGKIIPESTRYVPLTKDTAFHPNMFST